MKIAVFGSNGYIGKHLVIFLRKLNIEVFEYSSSAFGINPTTGLLNPNFQFNNKIDQVIFLSQSPFYSVMPEKFNHLLSVNSISPIEVALRAHWVGAQKMIYFSSGSVYSPSYLPLDEKSALNRQNHYALSKIHAEESLALLNNVLEVISLRVFGVFGWDQSQMLVPNLFKNALTDKDFFIEKNKNDDGDISGLEISLCHIQDLLNVIYHFVQSHCESGSYNVASDQSISIRGIIELIGEFLNKNVEIKLKNEFRNGNLVADISKLRSSGYEQKFLNLQDMLKHTFSSLQTLLK